MKILALDTTSNVGSIALLEDENLIAEQSWENPSSHTALLPVQFQEILQKTKSSLDSIDLFAVTKGPGSFTGVRIGLAFIKGLTLLNEKPVMGISTLEAMAMQVKSELRCPVLDARRGQLFGAAYLKGEALIPEGAYNPSEFFQKVYNLSQDLKIFPDFKGNAIQAYSQELHQVFTDKLLKNEENLSIPLASFVGQKASENLQKGQSSILSHDLLAEYLRSSAAES